MGVATWSRQTLEKGTDNIATQTAATGDREVNKAWFMAVLGLTVFATISAILIIPPLLVEIATDLDISVAVAGQLATATFAAWAVTGVSAGPLSDSFGRRPVAIVCLAALSISMLACAIAPNLETLLTLRVLTGLGGGVIPPNIVGSVTDVISPARRAQAVSALLSIQGIAAAVSVPLVAVLADVGGWRLPFVVYGALLGAGLAANWLWLPKDRGERVRNLAYFSRYRSLVSMRFFRVAVAVNLTQRIAYWGSISYFAAYLIHTFQLSVGFVALPLAIAALGQTVGNYGASFVANLRRRGAIIAAVTVAGGAFGLVLFSVSLGLWATVAVATVSSGLLSMTFPILISASTEYSGESKATGVGLMGFSNQAGGMLGAAIAGALLAGIGYVGIGYMCLAATIISALLTTLFGRQFGESAGQNSG